MRCKECYLGTRIPRGIVHIGSVLNGYLTELPLFGEVNVQRGCFEWKDSRDYKPEFVDESCEICIHPEKARLR